MTRIERPETDPVEQAGQRAGDGWTEPCDELPLMPPSIAWAESNADVGRRRAKPAHAAEPDDAGAAQRT